MTTHVEEQFSVIITGLVSENNERNISIDSPVIETMYRNVGWSEDENLTYNDISGGKNFDIVFAIATIVREHSDLLEKCKQFDDGSDGELLDMYYRVLYGVAANRMQIWTDIAIQHWTASYDPELITPIPDILRLPPKSGRPAVSVYGNMLDKYGRSYTIEITDQTDPMDVLRRIPYATYLWDTATEMTPAGIEFNKNGDQTFKERRTYIPTTKKPRKKKATTTKPASPKKAVTQKKPATPKSSNNKPSPDSDTLKNDDTSPTKSSDSQKKKPRLPKR